MFQTARLSAKHQLSFHTITTDDSSNCLVSGQLAAAHPIIRGGVTMKVERVPADYCIKYFRNGGLPLSASNSMNFVADCLSQPSRFVARNHTLFSTQGPVCHWGYNERCSLDLVKSNQPPYPHGLGTTNRRLPDMVFNIQYGTGARIAAP
ncbi:hypothetical protein C8A05DRAFT_14430 [Staphylotrichum tortipilum]|uniref:Uncharacterized protein n=1 Tax=Staphylotrichum tortipilum TaxID=2831512 RepID=A0AAN6MNK5_9PEZI|nr:hypothetical protein C8A05DRAFT_14430 [Staphylotrichum longicolle]